MLSSKSQGKVREAHTNQVRTSLPEYLANSFHCTSEELDCHCVSKALKGKPGRPPIFEHFGSCSLWRPGALSKRLSVDYVLGGFRI